MKIPRMTLAGALVGAVALALIGAAPASASARSAPRAASVVQADLQQAVDGLVTAGGGVGAQALYDDGAKRWAGVSGSSRLERQEPVAANGRFRAGSITKTFVATVVMQLVAEKRIGLDDAVSQYVPGLVPNGENITVRQLLNHTSGLTDYTEDKAKLPMEGKGFLEKVRFQRFTDQELVRIATALPTHFPPGQGQGYSNTNYVLLGMVITKITNRPWETEVEQRILRPLGLRDTYLPGLRTTIRGPHLHGYLKAGPKVVDVTRMSATSAGAAGAMISTNQDLNRFFAALLGGRLLPQAVLATMKADHLGMYKQVLSCGVAVWGHDGGIQSYAADSVHTEDGRHLSLAVSLPDFSAEAFQKVTPAVQTAVEITFCGPSR